MPRKTRILIPEDVAAQVGFSHDRICCVCRMPNQPTQIHHIDDDPSNNLIKNLALLCLRCHDETQIRGGFARRLTAKVVTTYRDDWVDTVSKRRAAVEEAILKTILDATFGGTTSRAPFESESDEKSEGAAQAGPNPTVSDNDLRAEIENCRKDIESIASQLVQRFGLSIKIEANLLGEAIAKSYRSPRSSAARKNPDSLSNTARLGFWISSYKPISFSAPPAPDQLFDWMKDMVREGVEGPTAEIRPQVRSRVRNEYGRAKQAYLAAATIPINEIVALNIIAKRLVVGERGWSGYAGGETNYSGGLPPDAFWRWFFSEQFDRIVLQLRNQVHTEASFVALIDAVFSLGREQRFKGEP